MRIDGNPPQFFTGSPANSSPDSLPSYNRMPANSVPVNPVFTNPADFSPAPVQNSAYDGRINFNRVPGVTVDLSPQTLAAYNKNNFDNESGILGAAPSAAGKISFGNSPSVPEVPSSSPVEAPAGKTAETAPTECQTCKNRRYVDQSDDPSVSFQTPANISPGESAAAVRSHENEHVSNEQARADREGRKVVSQSVSLQTAICPECGKIYVSGGVTRTITKADNSDQNLFAEEKE